MNTSLIENNRRGRKGGVFQSSPYPFHQWHDSTRSTNLLDSGQQGGIVQNNLTEVWQGTTGGTCALDKCYCKALWDIWECKAWWDRWMRASPKAVAVDCSWATNLHTQTPSIDSNMFGLKQPEAKMKLWNSSMSIRQVVKLKWHEICMLTGL